MVATLNIHPSSLVNVERNIYKTLFLPLFEKNKTWNKLYEEKLLRQKNREIDKKRLANKKIYFGHQSVGYNMIDGVESVLKQNTETQFLQDFFYGTTDL